MTEIVGVATGVAGLAGAFTACIDCFEYVQLGRQFGKDYERCVIKLDATKLRMSRWGASMGLDQAPDLKSSISVTEKDEKLAQDLLGQILNTVGDAERISERFKKNTSTQGLDSTALPVDDANPELSPNFQRLHRIMSERAKQRQKRTSFSQKFTWAIYEKRYFDRLIDDVTDLVNRLVELFPTAKEGQKALCKADVLAIKETRDIALLNDIAGKDDEILATEMKKEMNNRGHDYTDMNAGGNSKVHAGDENALGAVSKGHVYQKWTVSGFADVHLGNVNRG